MDLQTTIVARNFRALRSLEWVLPPGVNLLVGPNGSGKTTVLSALKFFRRMFTRGLDHALAGIRGVYLSSLGASPDDLVHFELHVGELRWIVDLPVDAHGLTAPHGELLLRGAETVLQAPTYQQEWVHAGKTRKRSERRSCAQIVWDQSDEAEWMRPLVQVLLGLQIYEVYRLDLVRFTGPVESRQNELLPPGSNLWAVLAQWKRSPRRYSDQFEWVLQAMRDAFPELVSDIEFTDSPEAQGLIFQPGDSGHPPLPAMLAADGVLTGLLHLTAVAGARPGSILAFDEMENQLHPFAIRSILRSMRNRAEERDLTILLTSHSPTVMDTFTGHEDQFFVLEPGRLPLPVALSELHDTVWFTSFTLGRRYDRGDMAAPRHEV